MDETVTISRRFNGPPESGHGGYTCGLVATALTDGAVEVTLRSPPPVERPLLLATDSDRVELRDDEQLVAEGVTVEPQIAPPDPISFAVANAAAATFDAESYAAEHPFPTCFACGPGRAPGDGLRLFPAEIAPHLIASPWVPDESLAADDGLIDPVFLWAALDCPSGLVWVHDVPQPPPHVLGRMAVTVQRRPAPGNELVVAGWHIGIDGRKRRSGAVVWDSDGAVVAASLATWISLDPSHHSMFRPARTE